MDWRVLASGVYSRTHDELDLTVGLIVGSHTALLIDCLGDPVQGRELAAAVRTITHLPLDLAITHGHFDHCFGAAALPARSVWAHAGYPGFIAATAADQRARWVEHYTSQGSTTVADALRTAEPVRANRTVTIRHELDLGGRTVLLAHLGPGHTDHDLVVTVPDASVAFAGDLVEQAGPPDFEDALPAQWPTTLDGLLGLGADTVVAGHGQPVSTEFVRAQRDEIAAVAGLRHAVHAGGLTTDEAVRRSPYPADTTRTALAQ